LTIVLAYLVIGFLVWRAVLVDDVH